MMRRATRRVFLLVVLIAVSSARLSAAATYTVTNTNDSGPGSLRQAILDANANSGVDMIAFAIGSGPQTIAPLSPLPTITDPIIIDGTTQPGYPGTPIIELSGANAGTGADGLTITAGSSLVKGLVINRFQAAFLMGGGNGIVLQSGGGNVINGNYIGTDIAGAGALGNQGSGILASSSSDNAIRFVSANPTAGFGNLISGNATGIRIQGNSDRNVISGNYIGLNRAGTAALPNFGDGIWVAGGSNNAISGIGIGFLPNLVCGNGRNGILIIPPATGTDVEANSIGVSGNTAIGNAANGVQIDGASGNRLSTNVISGNGTNGVLLINGATNNVVSDNDVGRSADGFVIIPNAFNGVIASAASGNTIGGVFPSGFGNRIVGNGTNGVRLRSGAAGNLVIGNFIATNTLEGVQINDGAASNTVGGTTAGLGNVICGNGSNGVLITDATTASNVVTGNRIGIDSLGTACANTHRGISIELGASGNTIGGVAAGEGNSIAFNTTEGVFVESGTGNAIRGNSIFQNGGLGIDLAPPGVNPNDHCDGDGGPNLGQNFPVLLSASSAGGTTTMQAALDSTANSSFTVDFYGSPRCDAQGLTAATRFLGSALVTTDASCVTTFQAVLSTPFPVRSVIATATDSTGNTSEFSACIPVPASFYSVTPCRLIDTRGAPGPYGGPALAAGTARVFVLGGQCGIPPSAKAVAVNVVVTQSSGGGHLRVYPAGESVPPTATLNYSASQTRANNAVVTLGQSADTAVRCFQGLGTAHLVVDVTGYFE